MAASMRLSKAMEEWAVSMRGQGLAKGTIDVRMSALRQLIRVTGDIYVRSLTRRHIDLYFDTYHHWSAGMRNQRRLALSAFQGWARRRGYIERHTDLLDGMKRPADKRKKHVFLTEDQLAEMLDKAPDPRDRIIIAMSVYLGLRTSEVTPITWGDLWEDGDGIMYVRIRRSKKGTTVEDDLPVRGKLRKEIRRWQIVLCRHMGAARPKPEWYIICPKITRRDRDSQGRYMVTVRRGYDPTVRLKYNTHNVVKTALRAIGINEKGEATHVLRRSGAASIRREVDAAGENGLRVTQLMLGHEAQSTTELYLDFNADRERRNSTIGHLDDGPDPGDEGGQDAEIITFPGGGEQVG